jgi:hypothetical protein
MAWAFGRPVNASANTRQHTMQGANVTALCLFPHKLKMRSGSERFCSAVNACSQLPTERFEIFTRR